MVLGTVWDYYNQYTIPHKVHTKKEPYSHPIPANTKIIDLHLPLPPRPPYSWAITIANNKITQTKA